jgi:hypothetical protein
MPNTEKKFRRDVLLRLHLEEKVDKESVSLASHSYCQERFWLLHDALMNAEGVSDLQRSTLLMSAFNERRSEVTHG